MEIEGANGPKNHRDIQSQSLLGGVLLQTYISFTNLSVIPNITVISELG